MKLDELLELKGLSRAELSRRIGLSKAAISRWGDEVPEKWVKVLDGLAPEVPIGEVPDDIWKWSPARIKEEVCVRRGRETDYEIARSLGLRVWEFNRLIDKVRQVGIDIANGKDVERLQVIKNG